MNRRSGAAPVGALALLLLTGAAPTPPPPPPAVGVTVTPISGSAGARRTDAVLPGRLLDTALPRGADGRRRLLALTAPDDPKASSAPEGPRALY
ncbi:MAG TPA: hypothetical protein VEL74_21775, partial [Thermoanaerobaculia bacterium]|nr:hypothetical protein [Thermoanaerobaculia bacterium]